MDNWPSNMDANSITVLFGSFTTRSAGSSVCRGKASSAMAIDAISTRGDYAHKMALHSLLDANMMRSLTSSTLRKPIAESLAAAAAVSVAAFTESANSLQACACFLVLRARLTGVVGDNPP